MAIETACAAVTATAFIGRKNFWLDEGYSFVAAHRPLPDVIRLVAHDHANVGAMGVYYVALHYWLAVGRSEGVIRLLSVPAAVATVPVVADVARRLYGTRCALIAGALTAVNAMMVQYAQEARAYSLLLFTSALSIWLFVACVARPRARTAVAWMVTCVVGFYTHYAIGLLMLAELATLLALPRAQRPRVLLMATGGVLVLAAPLMVAVAAMGRGGALPAAQGLSLADPARLLYRFSGSVPLALVALALLAVAAVSTYHRVKPSVDGRWTELFAWVLLVVPPLLLLAASVIHPAWRERYLIICLPAFLLLLARSMDVMRREWVRRLAVASLVSLSVATLGLYYAPQVKGAADWRAASSFALNRTSTRAGLWFIPSTGYAPFDYYVWKLRASSAPVLQLGPDPLGDSIHPRTVSTRTVRARALIRGQMCVVLLAPTTKTAPRWTRQRAAEVSSVLRGRFQADAMRHFGALLTVRCFQHTARARARPGR